MSILRISREEQSHSVKGGIVFCRFIDLCKLMMYNGLSRLLFRFSYKRERC